MSTSESLRWAEEEELVALGGRSVIDVFEEPRTEPTPQPTPQSTSEPTREPELEPRGGGIAAAPDLDEDWELRTTLTLGWGTRPVSIGPFDEQVLTVLHGSPPEPDQSNWRQPKWPKSGSVELFAEVPAGVWPVLEWDQDSVRVGTTAKTEIACDWEGGSARVRSRAPPEFCRLPPATPMFNNGFVYAPFLILRSLCGKSLSLIVELNGHSIEAPVGRVIHCFITKAIDDEPMREAEEMHIDITTEPGSAEPDHVDFTFYSGAWFQIFVDGEPWDELTG